jgi:hypothetical protein
MQHAALHACTCPPLPCCLHGLLAAVCITHFSVSFALLAQGGRRFQSARKSLAVVFSYAVAPHPPSADAVPGCPNLVSLCSSMHCLQVSFWVAARVAKCTRVSGVCVVACKVLHHSAVCSLFFNALLAGVVLGCGAHVKVCKGQWLVRHSILCIVCAAPPKCSACRRRARLRRACQSVQEPVACASLTFVSFVRCSSQMHCVQVSC